MYKCPFTKSLVYRDIFIAVKQITPSLMCSLFMFVIAMCHVFVKGVVKKFWKECVVLVFRTVTLEKETMHIRFVA